VGEETRRINKGESLRYRGDLAHRLRNAGDTDAHATMVLVLRSPVSEDRLR